MNDEDPFGLFRGMVWALGIEVGVIVAVLLVVHFFSGGFQ